MHAYFYGNSGNNKLKAPGDYRGAITDYDRALKFRPQAGQGAYHNRGIAERVAGALERGDC